MVVSSDSLQVALVAEASPGVTPATPAFDLMRITGEGLIFENTSTNSAEMGGLSRGTKDTILTGAEVSGDINFELSKHVALENLVAAALANTWGNDPHTLSTTPDQVYDYNLTETFTIEKRWQMDDAPTYNYQRFIGCMTDTMSLSITPGEPITGSFGFVGNQMDLATAPIAGATYVPAGTDPVMTAPLVTDVTLLDYETDLPVSWLSTACFTNVEMALTNNSRGIQCIGTLGNKSTVLGNLEITVSGSLYYSGNDPLQALIDQEQFVFVITTTDSVGNSYTWRIERVKFTTATVNATGTNEDVLVEFELQGLEDTTDPISMLVTRAVPAPFAATAKTKPQTSTKDDKG